MAYIKKILDKDGNEILPITCTEAVIDGNSTLESRLQSIEEQDFKVFRGWWPNLATLKAAITAEAGFFAYIPDASPATTVSIYAYDSTASSNNYWADSGRDFNPSNNQEFASGEALNEVSISDEFVPSGQDAVFSANVNNALGRILYDCITANSSEQITTQITSSDLQNTDQAGNENTRRIATKSSSLVDVKHGTSLSLYIPYSAILSNNIDRCNIIYYSDNKTWISGLDSGWSYFNGGDVTINVDLTQSQYSNVCYVGVYFGSNNVNISPSSIGTGITFTYYRAASFSYKKAVDEDTFAVVSDKVNKIFEGSMIEVDSFAMAGAGNTGVNRTIYLTAGKIYTITINPKDFSTTGVSTGMNIFSLFANINGTSTEVFKTMKGTDLVTDHTITAVAADYYTITIRAAMGVSVNIGINTPNEYVDDVPTEGSDNLLNSGSIYNALNDVYEAMEPLNDLITRELELDAFTHGYPSSIGVVYTRYRFAIEIPQIPISVKVEGVPSSYVVGIQTNSSIADALNSSVNSIEGAGWGTTEYEFTNTSSKVVCVGFKIGSAGTTNFTQSDIDALMENVKVTFYPWTTISGGDSGATDIISLNDERLTTRYLTNLKRPNISDNGQYTWGLEPFTLLHFSDIHADGVNLKRIMDYKEHYASFINDAICTGDLIRNKFSDSYSFWDSAGAESVLVSTGNHEYYNGESSAYYTQITPKQVYDKFFAPYISEWGTVVFPDNAATEGYNYYYKDYVSQKIRLIVLDNMANMSATRNNVQATWLASVLESARQSQYHVICAIHIGSTLITPYDTPFFAMRTIINSDSGANSQTYAEFYTLRDAVETFIDNGGKFVCWIGGHKHSDCVALLTGYRQGCFHVPTAAGGDTQRNVDGHVWWLIPQGDDCSRADGTKSQDCFNIYSVDTEKGMLRLFRAGNDLDRYGRHKGMLVYDYFNRQVIYSN